MEKMKNVGAEVFYTNSSHTLAPHIFKKNISIIYSKLFFADSIILELCRVYERNSIKEKSPEKIKYLLSILKEIKHLELGLRASIEYEMLYGYEFLQNSLTDKIRPISDILKQKPKDIYIRLSDDMPEEVLLDQLSAINESLFINAIIVDANLDKKAMEKHSSYWLNTLPNSQSNLKLKWLREIVGKDFPIISCGAVNNGESVFYRIKSGADFVFLEEDVFKKRGPYCLEKIARELRDIMIIKNIRSIEEIKERGRRIKDLNINYINEIYNKKIE